MNEQQDDGLDIPEFLRLTTEQRAHAWREHRARPDGHARIEDRGPGSVCRRMGLPDGINQDFVAELKARDTAAALAKRERGLASLAAWKGRDKAEKAGMAAVRKRARQRPCAT